MMSILVLVHEGGHFFSAKLSGVKVNEFAIGMGPQIFKKQGKETLYSLRLFPIGGFVKMEGEDEESDDERSFFRKPVYKKIFIVTAGALMNLLLGFLIMLFLTISSSGIPSTQIAEFNKDAVSVSSGLQVKDKIIKIDNSTINTYLDINFTLALINKESVKLTVIRDGKKVELNNVKFPKVTSNGITGLDIDFKYFAAKKTPLFVLKESFFETTSVVRTVWVSFVKLVSGTIPINRMSGALGISDQVDQVRTYGFINVIFLFAFITINLGVVNLLPLPALDGGRLIFLIIELIFRKPVPQKFEGLVHFIGFALLMILMVFLTYNDILKIFSRFAGN